MLEDVLAWTCDNLKFEIAEQMNLASSRVLGRTGEHSGPTTESTWSDLSLLLYS